MGIGRCVLTLLFLSPAIACFAQDRPQDRQPITNYWRHILDVMAEQELREEQLRGTENMVNPPAREYPFDAFAHLATKDLLRAVAEGIEAAKREQFRKPEAVVDQAVRQNIVTALEYYPVVARDQNDFKPLLYAAENPRENKQLRLYILEHMAPEQAPRSLFGMYMQDRIAEDPGEIRRLLGSISQRVQGDPEIFLTAVDSLYSMYREELETKLQELEPVRALADEGALTQALLADGAMESLPDEARIQVAEFGVVFNDLVKRMEGIIDPFAGFTPDKRLAAREILARIHKEIPLENRAQIEALLEQYPVEELEKPLERVQPPVQQQAASEPAQEAAKPYDPNDPSTWPVIEGEGNAAMFAPPPGTKLPLAP